MFLATPEYLTRAANIPTHKLKTSRDWLKELVKERRVVLKRTIADCGIAEEHGEMEQLVDSFIEKVDDVVQAPTERKNQQAQKERNLWATAENIWNLVLKRKAQSIESTTTEKVQLKKKKAKFENALLNFCKSDTKILLIEEDVRACRELESKRLELEVRRLVLDERRIELDAKPHEVQETICKSELEEKKVLLDF